MNLTAEDCLSGVIATLNEHIAPALPEGFAGELMRLATLVLTITRNGLDDAAALRVAENEAMRSLFCDAVAAINDTVLAGRLQGAAEAAGTGLRISELDAENARLRSLLVDLHAAVEADTGNVAKEVDRRIWRMLKDFEAHRAPQR